MKRTITICSSMAFADDFLKIKKELEEKGHTVYVPDVSETVDYSKLSSDEKIDLKNHYIIQHLDKIKLSDSILVVNNEKNGIEDYIGGNTFLEMGFAFCLEKKIFLYNSIPEQGNTDEIIGLKPIVLNRKLNII